MTTSHHYDVAIIGSGIAGATLAAILARNGLRVILFEAQSHPKFAIGESMILETSECLRAMAELFSVPELAYLSSEHFFSRAGTSHGVKRHFSYLHHTPGRHQDPARSLQAVIPKEPHGHELHLYRQDSDYFMAVTAVGYGATLRQETPVREIEPDSEGVTVVTARGERYRAAYVVDAGGYRSLLADRFGLRQGDQQTHSRAIFSHLVGVPDYHERGGDRATYGLPFSVAEGTLHHIFEGGWLWVIPFNNHRLATNPLCSVGLMLDPRHHPVQEELSPEEEFRQFIRRYPSIWRHLADARPVRHWTRTGRIQYGSRQVVGDRWALLGHAAGFIDPLYSKGLYVTMMSTAILADLLLQARQDGDYSGDRFRPLERVTQNFVATNDRLIANSYKSWTDYRLWSVYSVVWLLGAYTEYVKLLSMRLQARTRGDYFREAQQLTLAGGGFGEFQAAAACIDAVMDGVDPTDDGSVRQAVVAMRAVFRRLDWMPAAFTDVLNGKNHLPANKLKLRVLKADGGFLGRGAYRRHFFGDHSMLEVGKAFLAEKYRYWLVPRFFPAQHGSPIGPPPAKRARP